MTDMTDMQAVILCGGRGTRMRDVTELLPKPMVNIGEYPIVLHIMKWYAKFGIRRFILCLGYKKESFINYFANFANNTHDITFNLKSGSYVRHAGCDFDWEVTLADTGLESCTGKRLNVVSKYVKEEEFFLTYGDGVSNIDIRALYEDHVKSGKSISLTSVNIPSRYGLIQFDGCRNITNMHEKNKSDSYINGGFMVVNRRFLETYSMKYENVFFEQEPLNDAIAAADVHTYVHNGFWQCMDNLKEYEYLNAMWNDGTAPWKC